VARPSIAQRILAENTFCVLLVRGENPQGARIYAYVAVRADRLEAFMSAQTQGTWYPENFGVILESGEGEPSPEVRERMTREYGFNHEAMLDIPNVEKVNDVVSNLSSFINKVDT
jgi:hypothetical protein